MKKTVLPAVFCLLLFGYANQTAGAADIWTETNSVTDFTGKWEGSTAMEVPENRENFVPKSVIVVSIFLEYVPGSGQVAGFMNIDFGKFLADMMTLLDKEIEAMIKEAGGALTKEEVIEAVLPPGGITKDVLWASIADAYELEDGQTIGDYFIQTDLTESADSFFGSGGGAFMINGPKDRIKMLFNEPVTLNMGDAGFTEITLERK